MMKKFIAMVCGLTMMVGLAACSNAAASQSTEMKNTMEQEKSTEVSDESVGGWKVNQDSLKIDDNQEAKLVFEKVMEGIVGYEYEVVAYLGSQVVQGINYAYLCKGIPVVPDAEGEYYILNVYEGLEGNAEITGVKKLLDTGDENVLGDWSYNQGDAAVENHEAVSSAFDKATEELVGVDYEPIFYIGNQELEGSKYAIFSSVTPVVPDAEKSFCLVYISTDVDGNVEIVDNIDVDLAVETENSEETSEVQIPNPYMEVSTLAEASAMTGFDLTLPEVTEDYPDVTIRVMDQTMIEVIFENKDNESDTGEDEGYRIRKASGVEDISGDSNDYEKVYTEMINNLEVTFKGNDNGISLAIWSTDGYTYAIGAQEHPFSKEVMLELIKNIK